MLRPITHENPIDAVRESITVPFGCKTAALLSMPKLADLLARLHQRRERIHAVGADVFYRHPRDSAVPPVCFHAIP